MVRGRPIYYGEPDDGTEGYFMLARAIIRRTLQDAQIDLGRCHDETYRRKAEVLKLDAQQWIASVLEGDTR